MSSYYAILFLSAFLGLFGLSSFFSCTTLGRESPHLFFLEDHFPSTSERVLVGLPLQACRFERQCALAGQTLCLTCYLLHAKWHGLVP